MASRGEVVKRSGTSIAYVPHESQFTPGETVRGVIEGDAVPQELIPRLIALYREGRLPMEKLIRTYEFEQIDAAFADAADGSAIKPVLTF